MEEGEIITNQSSNPIDDSNKETESITGDIGNDNELKMENVKTEPPSETDEPKIDKESSFETDVVSQAIKTEPPDSVEETNQDEVETVPNLANVKTESKPEEVTQQNVLEVKDETETNGLTELITAADEVKTEPGEPIDNAAPVESSSVGKNVDDEPLVNDSTETEEGELDDSSDEKEKESGELTANITVSGNELSKTSNTDNKLSISKRLEMIANEEPREFDDTRQDDLEQLDYDEDETEDKLRNNSISTDAFRVIDRTTKERSDGEVDSDSDGEIKSDGEDFEEGETRDGPLDVPQERKKPCRFFTMGNCTWGDRCRYLHPGVNDKGNYNMFSDDDKFKPQEGPGVPGFPPQIQGAPWDNHPPPFMAPPVAETAWEKGLRHAKELKKRALQRKVQEPDFVQKREVLSLNLALNEDRDMEFVDHKPLGPTNKGFDPFQEDEADEYAVPTPEEMRRQARLHRERQRPPQPHPRHPDKGRRPPHPEHVMHPNQRPLDRRPPSPHRLPPPGHFPPDLRRMSPQHPSYDGDRRPIPRPDDRRDENRDRHPEKDMMRRPDNRIPLHPNANRRDMSNDKLGDEKQLSDKANLGANGAPNVRSDQWIDPWARARPQARGRNKNKDSSTSSSGSSSGSSSRSSSRSSYSSRSSGSGSSRSSSRSSGSSRSSSFSSHSSKSPSPSKGGKPKKKVLASAKQRTAASAAQKNPQTMAKSTPPGTRTVAQIKSDKRNVPSPKSAPPVAKKLPVTANKAPIPASVPPGAKPPAVKKDKAIAKPKKQRKSSSSSEFSRSDSSASPSRGKKKSGSDSDSGSSTGSSSSSYTSSSGSSSSDSEDGKTNPKKSGKSSAGKKGQTTPKIPSLPGNKGKVAVPSKPGRKDVKMTIIDKPGVAKDRKRPASDIAGQSKKQPSNRRVELLEQLRAVEDAIARKRAKLN